MEKVVENYRGFSVSELRVMGIHFEQGDEYECIEMRVNSLNKALLLRTLEDFLECDIDMMLEDEDNRTVDMFAGIAYYKGAIDIIKKKEFENDSKVIVGTDHLEVIDMFLDLVRENRI